MADVNSPFLQQLPREIRDEIYETLLFAAPGTPRKPIPPAQISNLNVWVQWRLPLSRGSCFGMLYSCRRIHEELLEAMDRYRDAPLELELTIIRAHNAKGRGHPQIWPTWIKPPLLIDPDTFKTKEGGVTVPRPRCRELYIVFVIQMEDCMALWGNAGGPPFLRHLFGMLADFLLYGPLGLADCPSKLDQKRISEWDIDTLSLDVVGAETEFIDTYDRQPRRVAKEAIDLVVRGLSTVIGYLDNGAVSGRIGKIRLLEEGRMTREWLIDSSRVFPKSIKREWSKYGWVTDPELVKQMKVVRRN